MDLSGPYVPVKQHEHYPEFQLGNMICFVTSYASTCKPDDILMNQAHMREMNWYCSDVMVRGEYPSYAQSIWDQHGNLD